MGYECVVLFRNTLNGVVGFVGDDDKPTVFANSDEAIEACKTVPICRIYPYQIVELDEL
jgi:hypothetical protein